MALGAKAHFWKLELLVVGPPDPISRLGFPPKLYMVGPGHGEQRLPPRLVCAQRVQTPPPATPRVPLLNALKGMFWAPLKGKAKFNKNVPLGTSLSAKRMSSPDTRGSIISYSSLSSE